MEEILKDQIKTFKYEGDDSMINLHDENIPPCNKRFRASLVLKTGKEIEAPKEWRDTIWAWWYINRRNELIHQHNQMLIQVGRLLRGGG